jgi:hypothetical protein
MKKLLLVVTIISIFSLCSFDCTAQSYNFSEISIVNNSPKPLDIRDSAGQTVAVNSEGTGKLYITVPLLPGETPLRLPTSTSPLTSITIRDNENWTKLVTVNAKKNDVITITITKKFEVLINSYPRRGSS